MLKYLDLAPTKIISLKLCIERILPHITSIDLWLASVPKHQVEHITLKLRSYHKYLPECFYSQDYMISLSTRGYNFSSQETITWASLVVLEVSHTKFNGIYNIGDILLGCPALECFSLGTVYITMSPNPIPVSISHSNLKKLTIKNVYFGFESEVDRLDQVFLVDAPQLVELEILGRSFGTGFKLIGVFRSLMHVHFNFGLWFSNYLDFRDVYRTEENILKDLLDKVRYSKTVVIGPQCQEVLGRIN